MTTTAAHGFHPGTPGAQLHEHPIPGVPLPVAAPSFLVSFSFTARDKDAAQAMTEAVEDAMRSADVLPAFPELAFFPPVQVARNVAPVSSGKKVLRLDPDEVSALMSGLMVAIESCEDEDAEDAHLYDDSEQVAAYRALADKLLVAQRDGIA